MQTLYNISDTELENNLNFFYRLLSVHGTHPIKTGAQHGGAKIIHP